MDKRELTLVYDEIEMGDLRAFEKAVGSKLIDALAPRILRGEDGQPIIGEDKKPLRGVNMTTDEFLGAIMVALRQADRANQAQYTMEYVERLKLTQLSMTIDWGLPEAEANPTQPADTTTETQSSESA